MEDREARERREEREAALAGPIDVVPPPGFFLPDPQGLRGPVLPRMKKKKKQQVMKQDLMVGGRQGDARRPSGSGTGSPAAIAQAAFQGKLAGPGDATAEGAARGAQYTLLKDRLKVTAGATDDASSPVAGPGAQAEGRARPGTLRAVRRELEDAIGAGQLERAGASGSTAAALQRRSYGSSRAQTPAEHAARKPLESFGPLSVICRHCKRRPARYKSLNTGEKLCQTCTVWLHRQPERRHHRIKALLPGEMTEGVLVQRLQRAAEEEAAEEAAEEQALASMQMHVDSTRRTVKKIRAQLDEARGMGSGALAAASKEKEEGIRRAAARARERRQSLRSKAGRDRASASESGHGSDVRGGDGGEAAQPGSARSRETGGAGGGPLPSARSVRSTGSGMGGAASGGQGSPGASHGGASMSHVPAVHRGLIEEVRARGRREVRTAQHEVHVDRMQHTFLAKEGLVDQGSSAWRAFEVRVQRGEKQVLDVRRRAAEREIALLARLLNPERPGGSRPGTALRGRDGARGSRRGSREWVLRIHGMPQGDAARAARGRGGDRVRGGDPQSKAVRPHSLLEGKEAAGLKRGDRRPRTARARAEAAGREALWEAEVERRRRRQDAAEAEIKGLVTGDGTGRDGRFGGPRIRGPAPAAGAHLLGDVLHRFGNEPSSGAGHGERESSSDPLGGFAGAVRREERGPQDGRLPGDAAPAMAAEVAAGLGRERPGSAPAGVSGVDVSAEKREPLRRFGGSTAKDVGRGAFLQQFGAQVGEKAAPMGGQRGGRVAKPVWLRSDDEIGGERAGSRGLGISSTLGQAARAAREELLRAGHGDGDGKEQG